MLMNIKIQKPDCFLCINLNILNLKYYVSHSKDLYIRCHKKIKTLFPYSIL